MYHQQWIYNLLKKIYLLTQEQGVPIPPPEPDTIVPLDYKTQIVEVLDYNRIRVNYSYEMN